MQVHLEERRPSQATMGFPEDDSLEEVADSSGELFSQSCELLLATERHRMDRRLVRGSVLQHLLSMGPLFTRPINARPHRVAAPGTRRSGPSG